MVTAVTRGEKCMPEELKNLSVDARRSGRGKRTTRISGGQDRVGRDKMFPVTIH